MANRLCRRCNGYFHPHATECPNCGSKEFDIIFPGEFGYKPTSPTCFACKYSIKRKAFFLKYVGEIKHKDWKMHFKRGQIYCYRRAPLWVSQDGCCLEYYQFIKRPKTKLRIIKPKPPKS